MKLIVLGSSAVFPLPRTLTNRFEDYASPDYTDHFPLHDDPVCNAAKRGRKDRRMRSSLAVVGPGGTLFVDAGPDIRVQMDRFNVKPDSVVISHEHADATTGLPFVGTVPVFREKDGSLKPGVTKEFYGVKVLPFRVKHTDNTPTVGFLFTQKGRSVAYISDMARVAGIEQQVKAADVLFADGSILEHDTNGHMAIVRQLAYYKKLRLKRVIFTHIGHATIPHDKLILYLQKIYEPTEVAYDGMEIVL